MSIKEVSKGKIKGIRFDDINNTILVFLTDGSVVEYIQKDVDLQEDMNNTNDRKTRKENFINNEHRKYLIVGAAASGKDWLQKKFIEKGYKPLLQYTTRPQRPNENGSEYHFVTKDVVSDMISNDEFFSLMEFNDWYYGFTKQDFESCDVGILSVGNIKELMDNYENIKDYCEIIYLDIPEEIRVSRLKNRYKGGNEDDSVERRVSADRKDFKDFNEYTIRLCSVQEVNDYINSIKPN